MYFLVSPSRYYTLPIVGAAAWFLTLSVLLIYWLAEGRPVYPSQVNPYIPFISDIGAYRLKAFFITGSIVTAIAYAGTIFAAHHVRSDPHMYGIRDPPWKRVFSVLALVAGLVASVGCVGLATFDTRRASEVHGPMLFMTFLGIAVSATCTEVVYSDQMRRSSKYGELRKYCLISLGIFLAEVVLSVGFLECLWTKHEKVGGILEWVVAFVGSLYILAFAGLVSLPDKRKIASSERQPLLGGI